MQIRWQCEIDPYCRSQLKQRWPDIPRYRDVRRLGTPPPVDLVCGGFPCQPISQAASRTERGDGWLWPEMEDIIYRLNPRWVVIENPEALRYNDRGLFTVLRDLAALGFDAEWAVVRASHVGAPHQRARLWVVAHTNTHRESIFSIDDEASFLSQLEAPVPPWESVPDLPVDDGVSRRMVEAYGNAVVPQVAEAVGRMILEAV